jgi:PAS domain S-box-containing protein
LQGKTIIDPTMLFTFNAHMENPELPHAGLNAAPRLDWEQVLQAIPDGLIITDRDFNIIFINTAFSRISGRAAARIMGEKCHRIFSGELCHSAACPLTRLREAGGHLQYESEGHCKVHQTPWLVSASPYCDASGQFAGMVEKITDASTLIQIRDQLFHSRERLRKNMGAIIQAMSTAIEKRDPYTAGHQRRVAKLCRAIATDLGFSWEAIQGLRMAAAIHDLGKIHVPAAILNKPGPMSEHEMAIIRMHPRTAYDILKGIRFPWPVAETIYQHHERLDGSGYPRQLKGDEILLEARILAVADVVESMASFRPYRPQMDLNAAIEELRSQKAILYDARIVDACIALITEKGFDFKTKQWQDPYKKALKRTRN